MQLEPFSSSSQAGASLHTIAGARKDTTNCVGVESIDDTLDTGVGAGSEEEEADKDDKDVQGSHEDGIDVALFDELQATIDLAHAKVGHTPEDEAEKAVEER